MKKLLSASPLRSIAVPAFIFIALVAFGIFPKVAKQSISTYRSLNAISPTVVRFSENFDAVTAPALPAGWTTSQTGSNAVFETQTSGANSSPNALFTNNPATVGTAEVTSPTITLGNSRARLIFRHSYRTDHRGYDGGVLEVSVDGGTFQDVSQAGCEFVGGRYIGLLNPESSGNPLLGRQVWTLESHGYKTTIVNLPISFSNRQVRFRWKYATGDSFDGIGWNIDDVRVEDFLPSRVRFSEDFDSGLVIPSGWSTEQTDPVRAFRTLAESAYTVPNSVFTPVLAAAGTAAIVTPSIRLGGNAPKLIFQHRYGCDPPYEGGVLEISVNGGPFIDIVAAGGTFAHGGYNTMITANDNPLNGRSAWGGGTQGYVITEVNLPPAAFRQDVRFKWLFGTDSVISSIGWWIDAVRVTEDLSGASLVPVTIPAAGLAEPYPSEILVSDHIGLISRVQVNIVNFTHTSPDDVDLMLVSPSGRKVVLMSDVGGSNPVSDLSLTFDDAASEFLPDSGVITPRSYKPTNYEMGDDFPSPAPPGNLSGSTLGFLNGSEPNGTWRLFLVDDNGNNAGAIAGGWSISVESSPNVVTVPASGIANPYPAELTVSGRLGSVTRVAVTLTNLSHTSPDDLDIMLVAPNGRRVILMSDAGGTTEVGGMTLTFDDDATGGVPDDEAITAGSFRPTNYEPGDEFPSPAPAGAPAGSSLDSFFGTAPNGVWKLFVVDDTGQNFGSLSGEWSLALETSTGACAFTTSPTVVAFPVTGGAGTFNISVPARCPWTATSQSSFLTITSTASGEGSGFVMYSVLPNIGPPRTGTIELTNGVLTRAFQVQQSSGCPFSVAQTSINFDAVGGTGSVPVTAGDNCTWQASSVAEWIQITSAPTSGSGSLTFIVQPNASGNSRTGAIEVGPWTVTVNQRRQGQAPFDFDGDSKTDISIFRPSAGEWWYSRSSDNSTRAVQFGTSTDLIAPADFTGDGITDAAFFRPASGYWFILRSEDFTFFAVPFGTEGDIPAPSDYDGDSRADAAVYRPSSSHWFIRRSSDAQVSIVQFGAPADLPVAADYDGDGSSDIAIYRPSAGEWWIQRSTAGLVVASFGSSIDKTVHGDWTGDGKADCAFFRSVTGTWYILRSEDFSYFSFPFGIETDTPAPGDYDGDGKLEASVFRASQSQFFVSESGGGVSVIPFGAAGDRPVASSYVR